jgi:hypothetical protein
MGPVSACLLHLRQTNQLTGQFVVVVGCNNDQLLLIYSGLEADGWHACLPPQLQQL